MTCVLTHSLTNLKTISDAEPQEHRALFSTTLNMEKRNRNDISDGFGDYLSNVGGNVSYQSNIER